MKKIAALTMVRGDDFFLAKWVDYYGKQLGLENLYIYYDGTDQKIGDFCRGTNAFLVEKIGSRLIAAEKGRLAFLSDKAAELFASGYDIVIGVDADEYIVVDPAAGMTLSEYLQNARIRGSISALGLDVGQKIGEETDLHAGAPFLSQRHYARVCTRYTKPSILSEPLRWGSGFHRIKGHNFHIAKDLYLFHFGYSDMKLLRDRLSGDGDRISQGWEAHIRKRSGNIRLVTKMKARPFGPWTRFGRICQTICRPPYAWNKPAMFEMRVIVRIPDRFDHTV